MRLFHLSLFTWLVLPISLHYNTRVVHAQSSSRVYVLKVHQVEEIYSGQEKEVEDRLRNLFSEWLTQSEQTCMSLTTISLNDAIIHGVWTIIRRRFDDYSTPEISDAEKAAERELRIASGNVDFLVYLSIRPTVTSRTSLTISANLIPVGELVDSDPDTSLADSGSLGLLGTVTVSASQHVGRDHLVSSDSATVIMPRLAKQLLLNWEQRGKIACFPDGQGDIPPIEDVPPIEDKGLEWTIELGIGHQTGNQLTIITPNSARTVLPHPDDVKYVADRLLPPDEGEGYTISDSEVNIDLPNRLSVDLKIHLRNIFRTPLGFSASIRWFNEPGSSVKSDTFRRIYAPPLNPPDPDGQALIYYHVTVANRSLWQRNSFSLPLSVNYPIYNNPSTGSDFRLFVGTNRLLPERHSFTLEKGWDRFNSLQSEAQISGELTEVEWYAGFDVGYSVPKFTTLRTQVVAIYRQYIFPSSLSSFETKTQGGALIRIRFAVRLK